MCVNLILKLTFFEITELVIDHDALCVDGVCDITRITFCLRRKSVGLLTYGQLICSLVSRHLRLQSIGLICNSQTVLAAALTYLRSYRSITALDSILYLQTTHANLSANRSNSVVKGKYTVLNSIYLGIEQISKVTDSITVALDSIHKEFAASIVVYLVR